MGQVLHSAFEDVGSAGGHQQMAGGTIELGIFSGYTTDDEQLIRIIDQVITARLRKALNIEGALDNGSNDE
jgi:nanoRNase/pAp phosphatase (c-di-AMP/oligoRNAs hydrolase)